METPKPQPQEIIKPNQPKTSEISQITKIPTPVATQTNQVKPDFNTSIPTPKVENITPIQPEEVLTNNTLPKNNSPRVVNPITNDNNALSNSFKSSSRVTNNNSNLSTSVPRISDDVKVSSGRISRSNSKTPNTISGDNQGKNIPGLRNSLNRSNGQNSNGGSGKTQVSSIPSSITATSQSIPQRPKPKPTHPPESIKCISNCDPIYPSELQGVEGKATVKVNLDGGGNVLGVSVITTNIYFIGNLTNFI